jgi:hypothetical protein
MFRRVHMQTLARVGFHSRIAMASQAFLIRGHGRQSPQQRATQRQPR